MRICNSLKEFGKNVFSKNAFVKFHVEPSFKLDEVPLFRIVPDIAFESTLNKILDVLTLIKRAKRSVHKLGFLF